MIAALVLLLSGMTLATIVQYKAEMTTQEFHMTTMAVVLLALSAFIQALEILIENRIFLIDASISAFYLQGAVACWKMIFTIALLPFVGMIRVPEEYVTGGRLESLETAFAVLFANQDLMGLFLLMMLFNGLHAIAGMTIVKEESGMQR